MELPPPSSRVSRRVLLSTAAALPALSELVVATAANAQAPAGVLPSARHPRWNRPYTENNS
jgi:hypothetical protein